MHRTILALALSAILVVGAAPAWSEDDLPPTGQFFEVFDANRDGRVTQEEFRGSGEIFKLLDKDGDGTITPTDLGLPADFRPAPRRQPTAPESPAAPAGRGREGGGLRARLLAMDADKDGKVSREEWQGPAEMFARFDRNGDGVLDAADREGDGARGARRGLPGAEGGAPTPEALERLKAQAAKAFERLDANADGKLAGDEVPNPVLLASADKDGDGAISLAEFEQAHLARAARGGPARDEREGGGAGRRMNPGMLRRWDVDGDGKVSREEFPGNAEMFTRLDADGDGFLTEADAKALRAKPGAKDGGEAAPPKPPVTPPLKPLQAQDADGDGRLHRAEFEGSDEAWKRLDRNRDGWITKDELP